MSGCVHKQRERNLGHRLVALRTLHRRPVSHVRSRSLSLSRARALSTRLPLSHTPAHSCTHTHTRTSTHARAHTRAGHTEQATQVRRPPSRAHCLSVSLLSLNLSMYTYSYISQTTHSPSPSPSLLHTQLTLHQLPSSRLHNSPSTNRLTTHKGFWVHNSNRQRR